jgi:hypothetical protein
MVGEALQALTVERLCKLHCIPVQGPCLVRNRHPLSKDVQKNPWAAPVPHACHSGGRDREVRGLKLQPLGNSSYFKKTQKGAGGGAQVVERLPSKGEVWS